MREEGSRPEGRCPSTTPRQRPGRIGETFRRDERGSGDTSCGAGAIVPRMRRLLDSLRAGHTLVELSLVLTIIGLVSLIAVHEATLYLDRVAVRSAVAEAAALVARARDEALAQRAVVSLRIDTVEATVALSARGERLTQHALGHLHGVRLSTSRDSIAFDVRGLGYGAANLTLVARRGSAAETLVVSRLGRVRR
jgi:prepilin-type N-terminal cleavage/methylation domain-containing protein